MTEKQVFIKKPAAGQWGKPPEERTPEELFNYGIINVDKPKGPSSHQVADYLKKILGISRAGHSGTLDPQVTGVQPIALGKATRLTQFLLTAPKEYIGIMHLHKELETEKINEVVQQFVGTIKQLPPLKSSIKRQWREREIYELELMEIKEKDVLFRVKCQAGTYIRKLCHDLGQALGVGAHMAELRRIQAGPFTEQDNLVSLHDVRDAFYFYQEENNPKYLLHCLQPMETALKYLSKCWILDSTIVSVSHGRDVAIPGISKLENFRKGEMVAVLSLQGELIAIGEALISAVEINTKEKGLAIEVKKVFVEQR